MPMVNFTSTMTNSDDGGEYYEPHEQTAMQTQGQTRPLSSKEKIMELEGLL